MKVPSPVVGNIRPQTNAGSYVSGQPIPQYADYKAPAPPDRSGLARAGMVLGQSVQGLGQSLGQLGEAWQVRQEKTQKFSSLTAFNDWQTQVGAELTELKRNSPADSTNFTEQAEALYENSARKFLSTLPGDLQEEYKVKLSAGRQAVLGDALTFQYDQQDKFFVDEVSKAYEKAKVAVDAATGGDPAQLEAQKANLLELIATTDLPEGEKVKLAQNIAAGLESIAYKQEAKKLAVAGGGKIGLTPEISGIIEDAATRNGVDPNGLKVLAWIESKGDPNAQNPSSSAGGLFQFVDSTAAAYGLKNKHDAKENADAGARLYRDNRDGLKKALGREPSIGEIYLAHQQGLGGATALLSNPDARATDIVGYDAVRQNGGAPGMSAQEFANLWINKANALAGQPMLDSYSRFAHVPYEDRLNLRADAERDAIAEINAQAAVQKAAYQSQVNDLYVGIHDGKYGQADIDNAQEAWLTDYDDIAKAEAILDKRDKDQEVLQTALVNAQNPAHIWNPFGTEDMQQQNAIFEQGGRAAFEARDGEYVQNVLVPGAIQSQMIPSDAIGTLAGMVRMTDPQMALFGYETLAMLKNAAPAAFARQVDEKLAADVQFVEDRQGTMSAEELDSAVRGGKTPAERQARLALRDEARTDLAAKVDGIPQIKQLLTDTVGPAFDDAWTDDPSLTKLPWAAQGLERDFRVAYTDEYERRGNKEEATAAAVKRIQKNWSVSRVTGRATLMKYAPEKYMPAVNGDWSYLDGQVRQQTGLGTGVNYDLLSDQQTEQEIQQGKSPTYSVVWYDEANTPRVQMDPNNPSQYKRVGFAITPEMRYRQAVDFEAKRAEAEARKAIQDLSEAQSMFGQGGQPVPQELIDKEAEARAKLLRAREAQRGRINTDELVPTPGNQ